ncbi:MAG: hypothetical protein KAS02_00225 [Candidatus Pacebacteria bacterium]|nr:hypothetical protein [Candidatus Paceibacterota bacterium]
MEETLLKDKKYLMGILTGLILMAIIMVGFNQYQGSQSEEVELSGEQPKSDIETDNISQETELMTPETPHSPQLERLALILREAGRMLERMDEDIVEISETQIAVINQ